MKTPILALAGGTASLSNSATRYAGLALGRAGFFWGSTNPATQFPIPYDGTISRLVGRMGTTVATGSYTVSVQKNGADVGSPITATISSGQTFSDTSTTLSVSAGNTVNFKIVPTSTPTAQTVVQLGLQFESSTANRSVIFACMGATTTTPVYCALGSKSDNSTEALAGVPMPTNGTFERIFVNLDAAPGLAGSGKSRTFTLRKNGVDTDLTCTINETATSNNMVGGSVSVAIGDIVCLTCTSSGAVASSGATIGLGFQPTTDGESCQFASFSGTLTTTTGIYTDANGRVQNNNTTQGDAYNVAPCDFTAKSLYVNLSAAPSSSNTRTTTLNLNGSGSALTKTLTSSTASDHDTSHTVAVAQGDLLSLQQDCTGAPTTSAISMGWVSYIAPSAGGGSTHANLLLLGVG